MVSISVLKIVGSTLTFSSRVNLARIAFRSMLSTTELRTGKKNVTRLE